MDLDQAKWIHFIGIGGIGTSSLARILFEAGSVQGFRPNEKDELVRVFEPKRTISGSDLVSSDIIEDLKLHKVKVYLEQVAGNIEPAMDLVIYSPAVPESNPELARARELEKEGKLVCWSYPQALGKLTEHYFTIAIAGTHGKSTTTAMTALILEKAGLDPTVVIGTKVPQFDGKNFRIGKNNDDSTRIDGQKILVIEACEYKDSFFNFSPNILMITNIEGDHLDYFGTIENYCKTFKDFENKVLAGGGKVLRNEGDELYKGNLKVIGDFNYQNARLAQICGQELGIENSKISEALEEFSGTWRRMQFGMKLKKNTDQLDGEVSNKYQFTQFIDDYGHHPTEIKVTLGAIREAYPEAKILCVFQPHQYSRTKFLLKEFGSAFVDADAVVIPDIYAVRDSEEDLKSVSVDDLVKEIKENSFDLESLENEDLKNLCFVKNGEGLEKTAEWLVENCRNYDIVVTMGAGNISNIYKLFIQFENMKFKKLKTN